MIIIRILPAAGGKLKPHEYPDEHEVRPEPAPARLR